MTPCLAQCAMHPKHQAHGERKIHSRGNAFPLALISSWLLLQGWRHHCLHNFPNYLAPFFCVCRFPQSCRWLPLALFRVFSFHLNKPAIHPFSLPVEAPRNGCGCETLVEAALRCQSWSRSRLMAAATCSTYSAAPAASLPCFPSPVPQAHYSDQSGADHAEGVSFFSRKRMHSRWSWVECSM